VIWGLPQPNSRRRNGPISRRLLDVAQSVRRDGLTLGELVDRLAAEGLGLTLLLLTVPALIPLPGPFGMVFGTLVALVAIQIMLGAERLWLPEMLRRRPLPQRGLRNVIRVALDWTATAERVLRERRLVWLTGKPARMLLAPPLLLMAITIVLPIPFGNVVPALALISAALGFIAGDGLAVLASIVLAIVAVLWTALLLYSGAAAASYVAGLAGDLAAEIGHGLERHGIDPMLASVVAALLAVVATVALLRRRRRDQQTR
jgi:hypothetical protein